MLEDKENLNKKVSKEQEKSTVKKVLLKIKYLSPLLWIDVGILGCLMMLIDFNTIGFVTYGDYQLGGFLRILQIGCSLALLAGIVKITSYSIRNIGKGMRITYIIHEILAGIFIEYCVYKAYLLQVDSKWWYSLIIGLLVIAFMALVINTTYRPFKLARQQNKQKTKK